MAVIRTRTSIANMAADHLSATVIGNIEENYGPSKIYQRNYEEAVTTVLAEFPWLASKSRAILQPINLAGQAPHSDTGYTHAYPWPADCIRPIAINDRPLQEIYWDVETINQTDQFGRITAKRKVIYCDVPGPLSLQYASLIEPGDMSPHLALAVSIELAIRCEGPISNSVSRQESLQKKYVQATKGSTFRVGGFQVDSRSRNPKPARKAVTGGQLTRAGVGL